MKSKSTHRQPSQMDFGVCHLLNIDNSPANDQNAKKEPVTDIKMSSLEEHVINDNQKTCTNSEKKTEEIIPPAELSSTSSNKENSGDVKNENVAQNEIVQTNEKTEEKVEKGVTPKKGKNEKVAKTTSSKKTVKKEPTTPKEVKKPKSDTKKKKKAESDDDHGGSEEDKVKPKTKPTLAKAKSEVITTQRKSRGVSKEEFEKYSNLLNQKTHRKKTK